MIRLMNGFREVRPIEPLPGVPQTGDRIETFEGPMVAKVVVCEAAAAPGVLGCWRVDLEPTQDPP